MESVKTESSVDDEIRRARNDIRTDKLDVSYGELANMFEADELIIGPDYQRLYRWSQSQRSAFIESILLGFPTPAIFVAEDDEGRWELVDGLQRVSTVLEFLGVLKDADGVHKPALRLVQPSSRPKLPQLAGKRFTDLSLQSRLSIKRAGCRVEVIKVGSKRTMKYDVFERLNTGGATLTPQEVRNCVYRAIDASFAEWIVKLSRRDEFCATLGLTDFQAMTMYDQSLVLRYLAMKNAWKSFEHDVEPFITDYGRDVIEGKRGLDREAEECIFRDSFGAIGEALGEDAWRHLRDGQHRGPLSVYVFETVSVGVASNLEFVRSLSSDELKERILSFKTAPEFLENSGSGANIKSRVRNRMEYALSYFAE